MHFDSQHNLGAQVQSASALLAHLQHNEALRATKRPYVTTEQTEASPVSSEQFRFTLAYLVRHYAYRLAPRLASRLVL